MSIEKADIADDNFFSIKPTQASNAMKESLINTLSRIIAAGQAKQSHDFGASVSSGMGTLTSLEEQPVFPLAAHIECERKAMQEVLEALQAS